MTSIFTKSRSDQLENFIYLSLAVTTLRILFSVIAGRFGIFTGIFWGHMVALVIFSGQIVFLRRRRPIAWVLSVIQMVVAFNTGRGTFGYILNYLGEPFHSESGLYPHAYLTLLMLAEAAKTYFMFQLTTGGIWASVRRLFSRRG